MTEERGLSARAPLYDGDRAARDGAEISSAGGERRNCVPPDGPVPCVVLTRGPTEVARWPLPAAGEPDLSVVDALARLQLAARRQGWSIRVSDPPGWLLALIDLAGLSEVITTAPAAQGSAQDLAPAEADGRGGEDGDQAD